MTSLTQTQNKKIKTTAQIQPKTNTNSNFKKSIDLKSAKYASIQHNQKGAVNIISSTGGHSFLRMSNQQQQLGSQHSNVSNNIYSNISGQDNSTSQISSLRKSPTSAQIFNIETFNHNLQRKPSATNLKQNQLKTQVLRPTSGRPLVKRNNNQQPSFDKTTSINHSRKQLFQSVEQISINLHSNNQSSLAQSQRKKFELSQAEFQSSQKFKMLQQISLQATNQQFSKTLRSAGHHQQYSSKDGNVLYGANDQLGSEDEYLDREQQLQLGTMQSDPRSQTRELVLTDQVILQEHEIQTLKKQMDKMKVQIIEQQKLITRQQLQLNLQQREQLQSHEIQSRSRSRSQSNNSSIMKKKLLYYERQEVEEERKSNSQIQEISFEDSSLNIIEQKENPYLNIEQPTVKTLQRSNGKQTGSQQNFPVKSLVRSGTSQLNNKLGKMKSTADLFGDIKSKLKSGETIQDFILNQEKKRLPNLEDIIRESIIEASQNNTTIQKESLNNAIDNELDYNKNLANNDESLSLGNNDQSEHILSDLFSNKDTKFNESELDRLMNFSHQQDKEEDNNQKQMPVIKRETRDLLVGMNEDLYSESDDNVNHQQQFINNQQYSPSSKYDYNPNQNIFKPNQFLFDIEDSQSQAYGESRQVIMRNEDSFTSKQTNEYLTDLLTKHQQQNEDVSRPSIQQKQRLLWSESPECSAKRSSSNETARLSFSKENEPLENEQRVLNTQVSGTIASKHVKMNSPTPNIILQAQSIQSISELLKDNSPNSNTDRNSMKYINPTSATSKGQHITIVKAINLGSQKKFNETTASPPSAAIIAKKSNLDTAAYDKYKPIQTMNRQQSQGKFGSSSSGNDYNAGKLLHLPTTRNFAVWFSHIGKQQSITDARCANGLLHSKQSLWMISDKLQPEVVCVKRIAINYIFRINKMIRNKYECQNCKLRFDSQGELDNHQRKFCIDSDYGNVSKLDRRLHDLGQKDPNVSLGLNEIKQYLRGQEPTMPNKSLMGDYTLDELRGYFQTGKIQADDQQRKSQFKKEGDMMDQMNSIKKEKHVMRMQKDHDEGDLIDLLRDLEQRKEKELRAQIEKEEIQRNLKDLDKKQLNALERDRKKELERLAVERENLRQREQQMMEDVKKMEQQLVEQEKYFRKQKQGAERDPNKDWAMNDIRKKEMDLARERGERIVQIKGQRDKLERERERIMDDLDKVKVGNLQGIRKNDAARLAADSTIKSLNGGFNNERYQSIEPSLKDKLVNDQVKINYMREQQRKTMNEMMPEIDELDVLAKELEHRNFINETTLMANDYDGRNTPNKGAYLSTIRQKLEQQAAAPSSYQQHNQNHVNFAGNMDYNGDLPDHIPGGEGKKNMISNIKNLKDDYLTKGGEDPDFIQKVNDLESFLLYRKPLERRDPYKPGHPPQVNDIHVSSNQPLPYMPPPGMPPYGYPPPMGMPGGMPGMPPQFGMPPGMMPGMGMPGMGMPPGFGADPMMMQMNQMLQSQEQENQKLREVLEGLGSNGNVGDFDGIINQTSKELDELKSKILPGGMGTVGGGGEDEAFPEDFIFRQNEFRCEDLEVEERALMNLTSQEFDALRLISKLPVNSELYRYKMDQYKELSTMRAEIEKVLQEQRLEKIRRDFEKQKYEDERRFKHEKWLEDQKRQILEAKLKNAGRQQQAEYFDEPLMPQTAQQYPQSQQQRRSAPDQQLMPQQQQNQFQQPPPLTSQSNTQMPPQMQQQDRPYQTPVTGQPQVQSYEPQTGFVLALDHLFYLPREYRQVRMVYSVFLEKKALVEPRLIEMKPAEADYENPNFNKVFFNTNQLLKHVKPHPSANLIIELQVPDVNKTAGFSSFGWTILNVFDSNYNLKQQIYILNIIFSKGKWKLPVYRPPTVLDLDVRDIYKLKPLLQLLQSIRICLPKDEIFNSMPSGKSHPAQYNLPFIHNIQRPNDPQLPNQPPQQQQQSNMTRKPTFKSNQNSIPIAGQQDQFVNPPMDLNNRNPNYEANGVQVFIHFMRNLKNFLKMKIQVTLYEGVTIIKQDNYQDCNWATTGVEKNVQMIAPKGSKIDIGLDGQIQIYKPAAQDLSNPRDYGQNQIGVNGSDEYVLPINQDITWMKDLYNMLWDHNVKDNLYLLFQVFVIIPRTGPNQQNVASTQYEQMGYAVFQANNEDGTIKFGTYEQSLFRMPVNLFQQDETQLLPSTIKFSLIMPRLNPISAKDQLPNRNNLDSKGRPHSQQFIPNFDKQWTPKEDFQNGDGIDVYIDWGRYLPDNTMFSKVYVRVVESNGNYPMPGQRGYASIDFSTARNPFFGFKYEVRGQKFDPTLLLMVSFETQDRSSGKPCYAGHSYFPLFMDRNNQLPVTDSNSRSFSLHKGFYQMPIFCQFPVMTAPITYENFIYLERIPTASMLIRIYKAPKMSDGTVMGLDNVQPDKWGESDVLIQAPVYQEGIYNTQYFFNTGLENKLFYIRKGRRDYKLDRVVDKMLQMAKQPTNGDEDQKLQIVDSLINLGQNPQMIDMNYFSQYNAEIGFRVGVEAIYNNTENCYFSVVASVCPQAQLYDVNKVGPPADKFTDGLFMFQNIKETQGMSIIFDIKKYTVGANKYEDFGHAVFPLFSILQNDDDMSIEHYVNSGIYQLPVHSGLISFDLVKNLRTTKDALSQMSGLQSLTRSKMLDMSIIVKVVDNQRERHLEKGIETIQPNAKYMPQSSIAKLQYQPLNQAQLNKYKTLKQMIPKGETMPSFQQFLTDFLHTTYKL